MLLKKLLKKRSQITVFIILGMVVIVIFAFLLKASADIQKAALEQKAEEVITEIKQSQSIIHYMNLCLKQSAEEALITLGRQGARVWKETQNGSSRLNESFHMELDINGTKTNVSFGLFSPKLDPPINSSPYPNVPWYPEQTRNYSFINISRYYYLGENTMPFLCDQHGPNKYNASRSEEHTSELQSH